MYSYFTMRDYLLVSCNVINEPLQCHINPTMMDPVRIERQHHHQASHRQRVLGVALWNDQVPSPRVLQPTYCCGVCQLILTELDEASYLVPW